MNGKNNEKSIVDRLSLMELIDKMKYSDIRLAGVEG